MIMAIETNTQQGTIKAMSKDGKRFLLEETDSWYSVWNPDDLPKGTGRGAEVSFTYKVVTKGDRQYNNIVGKVGLVSEGSQQEPSSAVVKGNFDSGAPSRRDLSITRQVAAKILMPIFAEKFDVEIAIGLTMEVGEDFARWLAVDPTLTVTSDKDAAEPVESDDNGWAEPNVLDEVG
jgi:hypothetical protein